MKPRKRKIICPKMRLLRTSMPVPFQRRFLQGLGPTYFKPLCSSTTSADKTELDIAQTKLEILQKVVLELKAKEVAQKAEWNTTLASCQQERDDALASLEASSKQLKDSEKQRESEIRKHKTQIQSMIKERDIQLEKDTDQKLQWKETEKRLRRTIQSMEKEQDRSDLL